MCTSRSLSTIGPGNRFCHRRLSRLGPGVSWYDFDGDGWEDLILTGGRGGKLAIFTNDHGGNFRLIENLPTNTADQERC